MTKNKFYAVKVGYKTGIFTNWSECKKQVDGYSGAIYKSFSSRNDAMKFIGTTNKIEKENESTIPVITSYIDGSYNESIDLFSCGVYIITETQTFKIKASSTDSNLVSMRNVAGELMGVEILLKWVEKNISEKINLKIHYDYEGIERWANNEWKANKIGTIAYKQLIKEFRLKKNTIEFIKVKAHSGDKNNDIADELASEASKDFTYLVKEKLNISGEWYNQNSSKHEDTIVRDLENIILNYNEIFEKVLKENDKVDSKFTVYTSNLNLNEKLVTKFIKTCWKLEGNNIKNIKKLVVKLDTERHILNWEINNGIKQFNYKYHY